jgi:aspartate/methionine/tyrosine aminotransferase
MSIEGMESVVKFCVEENIVLLADEVYQENIWNPKKEVCVCWLCA